jgi:hypothetical protein
MDQQIEFWVTRYAQGDSAARRRQLPYDAPLRKAIDMMNKGQTQKDLFTLASAAAAKPVNGATAPKNQNAQGGARPAARPPQ